MQFVPLTNDASQKFVTFMNDQLVEVHVWYQDIGDGWYITLIFNGEAVVTGRRLNNQSRLIRNLVNDFNGELMVVPSTSPAKELGRKPWGNTHKFVYVTDDELKG